MRTAIILAAGVGNRLKPLTNSTPKPLLNIAGNPLVVYSLESFSNCGITEFIFVINSQSLRVFKEKLSKYNFNISYVFQDKPLGMADAILKARELVKDDFIVSSGDIIIPEDHIMDLINFHSKGNVFGTLSLIKANVDYVPGMGNVKLEDGGHIIQIIEKPPKEKLLSNYYSLPFYAFSPELFSYLEKCPISPRGEKELQDAVQMALNDNKKIKGISIKREYSPDWNEFKKELASLNVTNTRDFFFTTMKKLEKAGIKKPLDVLCTMIEPVIIEENSVIADDCLIGPNVHVSKNVQIGALTEISDAIVLDNCKIGKRCYIKNAIICEGSIIDDGQEIIGDKEDIIVFN
ncbi:MAG: sugar phosphate nucleotidyltransferase [Promethearchaeota archaeon]